MANKQANKPPKRARRRAHTKQTDTRQTRTNRRNHPPEKGQTIEKAESQSASQDARHISASPNRPQIPP
eukprot:3532558-Prymnesium_polylepis.1